MLLDFCDVSRAAIALLPHPHDDRPLSANIHLDRTKIHSESES
jgi:hypothetical protein